MRRNDAPKKFVMLSADKSVGKAYQALALMSGHELDHFSSILEVGYLGRFCEYDAAIVHQDLQPLSGLELAEYLEKLFQSLPTVLLTKDSGLEFERSLLPRSIVGCMSDKLDPQLAFDLALKAVLARQIPHFAAVEHVDC